MNDRTPRWSTTGVCCAFSTFSLSRSFGDRRRWRVENERSANLRRDGSRDPGRGAQDLQEHAEGKRQVFVLQLQVSVRPPVGYRVAAVNHLTVPFALVHRLYALRRVKDAFREHKSLQDPSEIRRNLTEAHKFLEIIKRQVMTCPPSLP